MSFDTIVDRSQTTNHKWAITNEKGHQDTIAMTIADMDFETPEFVLNSLVPKSHIFGYDSPSSDYYQSIINWQAKNHHVQINPEEIISLTGVLSGVSFALRTVTAPQDNVLIFDPVYSPFSSAVIKTKRNLIEFNLTLADQGQYQIDFDKLEKTITTKNIAAIILCNPQNPSGHIWAKEDLRKLVALAQQYHFFIISDEIHQDLVFNPADYTSLYELPEASQISTVITSATKTFNMPGVKSAYMFVKNEYLRDKIIDLIDSEFAGAISTPGINATTSALTNGQQWHDDLMSYLKNNRDVAMQLFENSPINPMLPESTYLMWLDFNNVNLTEDQIYQKLVDDAGVELINGSHFGANGDKWFRMNFATSTAQMTTAISHILENFR
jgi:cystathionine beta-lyase